MRKLVGFLMFFLSVFQLIYAEEKKHSSELVSPKCIKNLSYSKLHALKSENNKPKFCVYTIPKIHQAIWKNFCLKHLQSDPEACSEWSEDENGNLQLDFLIRGHSEAQIDRELLDSLGNLSHLIQENKQGNKRCCNYAYCKKCLQTVLRGVSYYEDEEEDDDGNDVPCCIYFLVYKCGCTGKWWLNLNDLSDEEFNIYEKWQFCNAPTIYYGYFDWHHQTYFHHLRSFLLYEQDNTVCNCYWPQSDSCAKEISDLAYMKLEKVFEASNFKVILSTFSPYLSSRSVHGFLSGLLTNTFFYSQYRDILSDLDQKSFKQLSVPDYTLVYSQLINIENSMQRLFLNLYDRCIQKHPHPKIHYERGMILFHMGNTVNSLKDIRKFIDYAAKNHYSDLFSSDLYMKEGKILNECLSYDEAIIALTRAIEKDPKNTDAYFERAIAYFETGNFSKALSDYLVSGIHPQKIHPKEIEKFNSVTFGRGIATGVLNGGRDSVTEFLPSILSCFRGIGMGIWAFVSSPIDVSQEMVDCAYKCLEFVKDNTKKEMFCKLIPELQECLKNWDKIDDYAKGKYIGYVVGKYGIDVFMSSGSAKAIQIYRNLRKANAVMTLETASISPKLVQEITEQSVKKKNIRDLILKSNNLKIQWDKQGKHIPGRHNYQPGKSIFEHDNPQRLIDEFAGTGRRLGHKIPGKPGYKEAVDFQEYIGIWKNESGQSLPTTRGAIHYSKQGTHIVPLEPK